MLYAFEWGEIGYMFNNMISVAFINNVHLNIYCECR